MRASLLISLSVLVGALVWGEHSKPPDAAEQVQVIGEMREYALNYTAKLPNFLCLQVTRRYFSPRDPRKRRAVNDVIQEQVNFYQHKESYQVQSRPNLTHDQLGGATSTGEWGSLLRSIFSPEKERSSVGINGARSAARPCTCSPTGSGKITAT